MQSKCTECGFKKSRFVKKQEAKSLLSNLGTKTPLSKIPLLNVLFWMQFHWVYKNERNCQQIFTGRRLIYAINAFKTTWFYLLHLCSKSKKFMETRIQILFTETSLIRLVFSMIWLTANQKISQKELKQTKF